MDAERILRHPLHFQTEKRSRQRWHDPKELVEPSISLVGPIRFPTVASDAKPAYARAMRSPVVLAVALLVSSLTFAGSNPHVITFGKPMPVKLFLGPSEDHTADIHIRSLFVDSKLKEFTTGDPLDVTERMFVVRRAFRINDGLPTEPRKAPRWMWQLGGWLLVDRQTGRVSQLALPEFDPFYSDVAWYRDYAAYCGINDDASKVFAIVTEIGSKKPIIRRELAAATNGPQPDSECSTPQWDRKSAQVTFNPKNAQKFTFTLPDRSIAVLPVSEEEPSKHP